MVTSVKDLKNRSVDLPKAAPRVAIDARMVSNIPHGISRYVSQLSKGLAQKNATTGLEYNPIFLVNPELSEDFFKPFQTHICNSRFLSPQELFEIPKVLKKIQADVYHSPSFSSLWSCPCPSIVTIHDLNHLTYGSLSKKIYYKVLLRRFAHRSQAVATVSKFSRQEISQWLDFPAEKIEIIYNALSLPPKPSDIDSSKVLERYDLTSKKYFFCLSNLKPHKNLNLLVEAYKTYQKQTRQAWPLVLSVKGFEDSGGIKSIGGLPEQVASIILANSAGMLFPSIYEGFGLPPIEAALLGTPIAVSRIPPHEEGLIDLSLSEALWVNATDFHGWVNAFHRIQKGEILPVNEQTKMKILDRFSIEKMALHMDQIYRRVLEIDKDKL